MKTVFCIGNGQSRAPVDLIKLRPHGKIYGCNGLYRDFTPDVLCSVDGPMMHEIYQSGYADNNETWFRDWNPVPGMVYESVVFANLTPEEIKVAKNNFKIQENKREDRQEFVFHGSSISGQVGIIRRIAGGEQIEKKQINHTGCFVSWINPNNKAHTYKDLEELYLIGHDLKSNDSFVNNMYKSTPNYADGKNKPIPDVNWISQWNTLMQEYPKVKFIKVNPRGIRGGDKINNMVTEWKSKNVEYINFDELNKKFSCVSGLTK